MSTLRLVPHLFSLRTRSPGPQSPPGMAFLGEGVQDKACCGRGIPKALKCQAEGKDLVRGEEESPRKDCGQGRGRVSSECREPSEVTW